MKKAALLILILLAFTTDLVSVHFPETLSEIECLDINLGGYSGAKLVIYDNQLFVLKKGVSHGHIENEFHTYQVYRALGVPVPEIQLYREEGKEPAILTEFIEGVQLKKFQQLMPAKHTETIYANIQKGFIVDCLLANWDVVGLHYDNIVIDYRGVPWRIDNGSGMGYSASGASKGSQWNGEVKEITTMRDPKISKKAARVFCSISDEEIHGQIENVLLQKEEILKVVPDSDRSIVEQRLEYLQELILK